MGFTPIRTHNFRSDPGHIRRDDPLRSTALPVRLQQRKMFAKRRAPPVSAMSRHPVSRRRSFGSVGREANQKATVAVQRIALRAHQRIWYAARIHRALYPDSWVQPSASVLNRFRIVLRHLGSQCDSVLGKGRAGEPHSCRRSPAAGSPSGGAVGPFCPSAGISRSKPAPMPPYGAQEPPIPPGAPQRACRFSRRNSMKARSGAGTCRRLE
jgi:hypothetical protein